MEIWFDENGEWRKEPFVPFPLANQGLFYVLAEHQEKYGYCNTKHNFVVFSPEEEETLNQIGAQFYGQVIPEAQNILERLISDVWPRPHIAHEPSLPLIRSVTLARPNEEIHREIKFRLAIEFNRPTQKQGQES